jgi:cell division protein FtsW (lipid II flippase)
VSREGVRDLRSSLYWPVIVPAALLLLCGVVLLARVEVQVAGVWRNDWHIRQLSGIAVALAAGVVAFVVPYKALVRRAYVGYAFALALLVLVLKAAERANTRRWINVFGFDFQPSELMKLALVVTLARFIRFRSSYKTFTGLWAPFLLTLVPMGLILVQPDLGTALLCIPILFTMLFVGGARLRHLGIIVLLGASAIYPVYRWGLQDYQKGRIHGFLVQLGVEKIKESDAEMKEHNRKELYQLNKSKVAAGAGGWTGVGGDEPEAQALYNVPERHNDFVFATLAHCWGWLGAVTVLSLFLWLLLAILAAARRQRDPAGRLICIGVFALFGFQGLVNAAMNIGLMPITGMTLPFLSYGRSSLVVSVLAVALVCNVAARPSYEFGRGDFE